MHDTIETARLMLRPPREGDLVSLSQSINSHAIVQNTARIPWPYMLDDAHAYLRVGGYNGGQSLRLLIFERRSAAEVIGGIGYEARSGEHAAEIGYWLAQGVWAMGYGFEAASAVTAHAFERASHDRLVAGYRHGNEGSRRILDRLGFRVIGHTMTFSKGAGAYTPTARLELTRSEWLLRRRAVYS